ncbi:MAG: sigma 54-dependent Fis family transcriptional regulator [Deltaproteobacteria bacterium]|nr:sigma 54-dependent Fis family transcriptional regulator [Deltaproteobacteria bacterium]
MVLGGPDQGAVWEGLQDEALLGTDPSSDLCLTDPTVAPTHCQVQRTAGGLRVLDLGGAVYHRAVRVHDVIGRSPLDLTLGGSCVRAELVPLAVEHRLSPRIRFGRLEGASDAMRELFAVLERLAGADVPVLLEGETGTGKDLAAQALHQNSARASGPFVALDCGASPKGLIESELFGHEKGAFTDAVQERRGALRAADRGTLLLDEVGELPLELQSRLLRVLETRKVRAVGSDRFQTVDVRVLAATGRNMIQEVRAGRFRSDLYYRLAVAVVKLPPLRARLEDLPLLVTSVLEELNRRRLSRGLPRYPLLPAAAMDFLLHHDYPGNVRELRNCVERLAVLGLDEPEVPGDPEGPSAPVPGAPEEGMVRTDLPFHSAKELWHDAFEKAYLTSLLAAHRDNISAVAKASGVHRRHLQRLMLKHHLRG